MNDNLGNIFKNSIHRRNFLEITGKSFLAATIAGTGTLPLAASAKTEKARRTDRSILSTYPLITDVTKEWRWGRVRKMMQEHKVDALFVMPGSFFDDPSAYLTNSRSAIVFFPLESDPIAFVPFTGGAFALDPFMKNEAAGIESWIRDWRLNYGTPDDLVAILKERKLSNARIGTVGVEKTGHMKRRTQKWRPGGTSKFIKQQLPNVELVELWDPYIQVWMVKNEEELTMFRKVTAGLELAVELFRDACQPGNTQVDVINALVPPLLEHGINVRIPTIGQGVDGGARWGSGMTWLDYGYPPPVIKKGEMLGSEIFANVGPMHAQGQVSVSVGKPSAKIRELADIAREEYNIACATCKDGIRFADLAKSINGPLKKAGAWHLSPRMHTLNPLEGVDALTEGMFSKRGYPGVKERFDKVEIPQLPMDGGDLILRENMTIQFETNACFEATYVVVGGNLIIKKNGVEELNKLGRDLLVVDV